MPRSSVDTIVAQNLKDLLKKKGRSAYAVATALGYAPNGLYQVLTGRNGMLLPTLREVAQELGVSVGELVDPPGERGTSVHAPITKTSMYGIAEPRVTYDLGDSSDRGCMGSAERLKKARQESGLTLEKVAEAVNTSFNTIWRYEAGHHHPSGPMLYALATLYGKPVDWFFLDDLGNKIAEPKVTYQLGDSSDTRPVEVLEVAGAGGSGTEVYDETPVGLLWFRNDWLKRHSIDPKQCNIINVQGESMEPTLPDGCSVLVDRKRTEPHEGRIYVMRTEEGLVVKRLGKDEEGRWLALSDNEDWEPKLLNYGSEIVGEVRWYSNTL